MCRVQNDSPIRILNTDVFGITSTTFDLPSYVVDLVHLLAEASSPPPMRTRPINNLVLNYFDIEAEQGKDSNRHDSPSS